MIKFENIPKLEDLKYTHGLFRIGTVFRKESEPLYLVWNAYTVTGLLLENEDLLNPVVYCTLNDEAKPKRNTGLSIVVFNREIIDEEPIAFYGIRTGDKLQRILTHIAAHLSLINIDFKYDMCPYSEESLVVQIKSLIKEHTSEA